LHNVTDDRRLAMT